MKFSYRFALMLERVRRSPILSFLLVLFILSLIVSLVMESAREANAQPAPGTTVYQPNFFVQITNYTALNCPSNTAVLFSPTTNQTITLRQNQGAGWLLSLTTTNSVPGNFTIMFDCNVDGVSNHWTTNGPHMVVWTVVLPANSTTTYFTNFGRDVANNARLIFPSIASNSCAFGNPQVNYLIESHGQ